MALENLTNSCADNIRERFFELMRQEDIQSTKIKGDICTNKGMCALGILGLAAGLEYFPARGTVEEAKELTDTVYFFQVKDGYGIGVSDVGDTYQLADTLFDMADPYSPFAVGNVIDDDDPGRATYIYKLNDRSDMSFAEMADKLEEELVPRNIE